MTKPVYVSSATSPTRIAMWSGPRNISTAMMRSWENRADTEVVDEPFYACYLTDTGIVHPMQEEVLASQSASWDTVMQNTLGSALETGHNIQYQKHMTHHMVNAIDDNWFNSCRHAFLIRHPAEVVASYSAKRESVTADDIGFAKQSEIYQKAVSAGLTNIPVIDGKDVLKDPERMLTQLCSALGVPFDDAMLAWPSGPRDSDGAWAPHWYQSVESSTRFGQYVAKDKQPSVAEQAVIDECMPHYLAMHQRRLR